MVRFSRILCPVDLSAVSARAIACAAALARWYDARLVVLHVVPTFDSIPVGPTSLGGPLRYVQPPPREEIVAQVRSVVDRAAGAAPLDVVVEAEAGDPVAVIVDRAVSKPTDLLVVGTHGRGGFDRLVLGSVAEKVLRKAPCPVLTVPPQSTADVPDEARFKHILCPVDFSPASLLALGFALDLARQADGAVSVVHVIEWLVDHEKRVHAHFNVPEFRRALEDEARRRLDEVLDGESRTWASIDPIVVHGRAHREILRLATEQRPDLIVMGAQGRSGLGLAIFGSTTQQVVRAASCPVLTVRTVEPGLGG